METRIILTSDSMRMEEEIGRLLRCGFTLAGPVSISMHPRKNENMLCATLVKAPSRRAKNVK